ncbi:hypothetical protein DPMN_173611 [Dreissena polymorpha]|uniref:Uncharacterized protein n=1 Tax=Dreissena polymorpha TaxID=45954 RepID=A0A9D4E3S3_DREPO|nr:hypothetical protein DPMN_173611 [Dreissena polymorpha]
MDFVCPVHVSSQCTTIDNSTLSCVGHIPRNVSVGTRTVIVYCLETLDNVNVTNGSFHGLNWNKVETWRFVGQWSSPVPVILLLNFESGAFTGLNSLSELQLSTDVYLVIYSGTFLST